MRKAGGYWKFQGGGASRIGALVTQSAKSRDECDRCSPRYSLGFPRGAELMKRKFI